MERNDGPNQHARLWGDDKLRAEVMTSSQLEKVDTRPPGEGPGISVDDYSLEEIELLYWGLGCHFGTGESQSNMGDLVGRVEDISGKDLNERAYRNSVEFAMQTDLTDIIAMLSIRQSARGGLSSYVSAAAIHNEILANRPELLVPFIYMAAEELGEPLTDLETEALSYFDELATRPDLRLDVMLQPGELNLINNYTGPTDPLSQIAPSSGT